MEYVLIVGITTYTERSTLMNEAKYIGLDVHQATISVAVLDWDGKLIMESIIAGARAYLDLTADIDIVREAIEVVTGGSIWAPRRLLSKLIDRLLKVPDSSLTNGALHLTAREKQVLELILQARSNREIARQLGIEERTVKAHVGRLMRKTGADNRIELTMRALNQPLVAHTHPDASGHNPGREHELPQSRISNG